MYWEALYLMYTHTHTCMHAVFILGYQYWETTGKFRGWSVCIEDIWFITCLRILGDESVNLGGISSPNSSEINTAYIHIHTHNTHTCTRLLMIYILNQLYNVYCSGFVQNQVTLKLIFLICQSGGNIAIPICIFGNHNKNMHVYRRLLLFMFWNWFCCYSYLEVRIKDGGGHNIQCPGGKCFRPIPSVSHYSDSQATCAHNVVFSPS